MFYRSMLQSETPRTNGSVNGSVVADVNVIWILKPVRCAGSTTRSLPHTSRCATIRYGKKSRLRHKVRNKSAQNVQSHREHILFQQKLHQKFAQKMGLLHQKNHFGEPKIRYLLRDDLDKQLFPKQMYHFCITVLCNLQYFSRNTQRTPRHFFFFEFETNIHTTGNTI